ncbi:MAG: hypothetical protein MUP74_02025, partial [Desulfobacterales bacterium]|nr:hypothetical protein [Desulfobacterales bacterium]
MEGKAKPDVTPGFSAAVDPGAQPISPSAEAADRPFQTQASRETQAPPPPKAPAFAYPSTAKTRPLTTRGREPARSSGAPVAQASPAAAPAQTGQIIFNFDDADVYEVIRTMAELLNINYIMDPNVRGKVTIHTTGGFARNELFNVFFQILEANGLTAVKEGNLYSIVRLKDATRMPLDSRTGLSGDAVPADERVVIQIVPLQFISAQEMTKLLAPFVSAEGTIISHTDSKTLLVVDKKINITKMLRLVDVFDANVFEKVYHRFYTLEHTDAEEAAKTLTEVMASYGAVTKEEVKFVTIPRLNMLLVVSPTPQAFDTIQALLGQIDIPSLSIEPRIFVYAVKNSQAVDLADLLTKVFTKKSAEKA